MAFVAAVSSVAPQLVPNTWIFRDGRFYVNVATTLVEDFSLDQRRFAASWYTGRLGWNRDLDPGWSNVALGARGEHWPKHPVLLPLLASPFYFALGIPATLLFNLAMFGVAAGGLFRFARAYAEPTSAAIASFLFLFATVIVASAYDFSTDVLMLALFAQGLASLVERRGIAAGVLFGACATIKPTVLVLLPSLAILGVEGDASDRRGDEGPARRRELARAVAGGAAVLGLFAVANTVMYGRPWWSGYNRTLVTVAGVPTIASHVDAFSVPLDTGLKRVLFGDYGLVGAFAVLVLAIPGLASLARRRPGVAFAALWAVAASLVVFAKYVYEGHRFHWPALALLVPPLARTAASLMGRCPPGSAGAFPRRSSSARVGLSVGAAALAATVFNIAGSPLERLGRSPWADAWLGAMPSGLAPDAWALAGIVLHGCAAALLCGALVALSDAPVVTGAAVIASFGAAEVRRGMQAGGPALWATALALVAIAIARRGARVRGSVERGRIRRLPLRPYAIAAVTGLGSFAFALLARDPAGESLTSALRSAWAGPSEGRALVPWSVAAIAGGLWTLGRIVERRAPPASGLLVAATALALVVPSFVGASRASLVAIAAVALAALAGRGLSVVGRWLGRGDFDATRLGRWASVALVACLGVGLVRHAIESRAPFRFASERAVREATVFLRALGIGEVPCDFLAWEHMSWECATFDRGTHGETGLAVDDPVRVGGVAARAFVLPTGVRGEARRVEWSSARAGRTLRLRWAVPDGLRGGGELVVRVNGGEVARLRTDEEPSGAFRELVVETRDAGETAQLEIEHVGSNGASVVALDGEWR